MQTLDEKPETIHLYVVREKEPKPSDFTHRPLGSLFDCSFGLLCFNPLPAAGSTNCYSCSGCPSPYQMFRHEVDYSDRRKNLSGHNSSWNTDDHQRLYHFSDAS